MSSRRWKLRRTAPRLIGWCRPISLGSMIDPGRTSMLVPSPSGEQTGITSTGDLVAQIPGSAYFQHAPGIIIITPPHGSSATQVTGLTAGDFVLAVSNLDFTKGADRP